MICALSKPNEVEPRNFCTYFDHNYLSRALALHASLCLWGGSFRLYALCLDGESYSFLNSLSLENVTTISLEEIEEFDQELICSRSNRSLISYYFTLTAPLVRYIMMNNKSIKSVTYLDSDIYFFGNIDHIFDEIGNASIAIVPHRFSDFNIWQRCHGLFNVGWITWRRDPIGVACLNNYRKQCLKWCHDYLDGDHFADQRYLDSWPSIYPGLHVIMHKGANLAPWNLDSHPLEIGKNGTVMVGDDPLIFYHFHRLRQTGPNQFLRNLDGYIEKNSLLSKSAAIEAIYRPYERALANSDALPSFSTIRETTSPDPAKQSGWEYRPDGWIRDAAIAPGLTVPTAIATMEQRLNIVRRRRCTTLPAGSDLKMHNEAMSIAYAAARAASGKARLSILDWYGGLGAMNETLSMLLPELKIDFHCREDAIVIERGRVTTPDVAFHDCDETAFARRYDLVLARGSLQRMEDWRNTLTHLATATVGFLLICDLTVVSSVPSLPLLRRVYGDGYDTAWACWAVNLPEMLAILEQEGLIFERQLAALPAPAIKNTPEQPELRSFLFTKLHRENII